MLGRPLYLWLLIPLVSALIGYFTNWVALRMLFRPYHEKRIFGLRIPFTPGLIPRKRAELARSIGRAVSERLVTREAITARLADEDIKRQIREFVHRRFQELLDRELPSLDELLPPALRPALEQSLARGEAAFVRWLLQMLERPETGDLLRRAVIQRLEQLAASPLDELLPEHLIAELPTLIARLFTALSENEVLEEQLSTLFHARVADFLAADRAVGDYLPEGVKSAVYAKLQDLLPDILEHLVGMLEDPQIQKRIKIQLYELVDRLLSESFRGESFWDQLKLTLFGTLVISPEELKERIDRAVEELAPRAAALVRKPEVQRKIYQRLVAAMDGLLARRPAELRLNDVLDNMTAGLARATARMARNPATQRNLEELLAAGWNDLRARKLHQLLPADVLNRNYEALADLLLTELRVLAHSPAAREALERFVHERLTELRRRPLGRLRTRVPEELVRKVEDWAGAELLRLLQRETPQLVTAIDIERLVADKVSEFSTAEMEELIVGVTGEQLRAITWFGAVLGFLIGLLQLGILLVH